MGPCSGTAEDDSIFVMRIVFLRGAVQEVKEDPQPGKFSIIDCAHQFPAHSSCRTDLCYTRSTEIDFCQFPPSSLCIGLSTCGTSWLSTPREGSSGVAVQHPR